MSRFISNQEALLRALADHGLLWRTNAPNGKEHWYVRTSRGRGVVRVLASTARAARRHKYIEESGALFWRLAEAGRRVVAALKEESHAAHS